jgi:dipeptidyl aminopeptidase/acylaminoacyl peptidase
MSHISTSSMKARARFPRLPMLVAFSLVLSAVAVAAQERFTPHHVATLRVVTQVALSPDGTRTAYVRSVSRVSFEEEDGPAWAELHVVGADGVSRPFVAGRVNVGTVRWSPDGRSIGFLTRRTDDRARALYVIAADGGEARRVLAHETDITDFEWSPDGTQVVFLARQSRSKEEQDLARQGFNQEIFEENVLPVRVSIAAIDETPASFRHLDLPGSAVLVSWSPDGSRLAVTLTPTALVDDDLMRRRVYIVDAASGRVLVDLENEGKLDEVRWSPDGRHVAFISGVDLHDPAAGRLVVVPATGGTLTDILPGYEAHVRSMAWKDADTLYFIGDEGVETTFNEVGRDGTGRRVVIPGGGQILTAFEPSRANGAVAFLAQTPRHPTEVYLLSAGENAPKRLTDSNPWLANMRFAPQEVVRFTARDGLELDGILIRPLEERTGERHPLILYVHGGPETHDRNGWLTAYTMPGQVGAAQGFAVFYPNYRGSTGRGVAFSKLGQGDPAGKEFDDLVDAVDHLIDVGLVDRQRVGITGGSYGGYASAWGATYYTERFAAR